MRNALLLTLVAACAGDPERDKPAPEPSPTTVDDTSTNPITGTPAEQLRQLAEADGHLVQDGALVFPTYEGCCDDGANCLGNNPATPYGTLALPLPPGAAPPDDLFAAWGPVPAGLHRDTPLRDDEAIVFIGRTPPPARYFGYRSYLDTRVDPYGQRQTVFASLGASLNHLVVAAEQGVAPEDVFDRPFVVVTTADAAVEARVDGWLVAAGFDLASVHHDRITHEVAVFGHDAQADTFSVHWRIAVPDDPAAFDAFMADPGATVLRITPEAAAPATSPHPWPELPVGGTGTREVPLLPPQAALHQAIRSYHRDYQAMDRVPMPANVETLACIPTCGVGDIHDRYTARGEPFLLGEDQFIVAFGVNHQGTGKASYSSVALKNVANQYGFVDVDSVAMVGSARTYLPEQPQLDPLLYAITFARDCAGHEGELCIEVGTTCPEPDLDTLMQLTIRAYLEPETGSAPLGSEMVPDAVTLFWK